MRIINNKKSLSLALVALIISLIVSIFTLYDNIKSHFLKNNQLIVEDYIKIVPSVNSGKIYTYNESKYNIKNNSKDTVNDFSNKITKQHSTFRLIINEVIESSSDYDDSIYLINSFCNEYIYIYNEIKNDCIKKNNINGYYQIPPIICYSITNVSDKVLKKIDIEFAKSDDSIPNGKYLISLFGTFLESPCVKNGYIKNRCIGTGNEDIEENIVKINNKNKNLIIPHMKPGETVLIPMHFIKELSYKLTKTGLRKAHTKNIDDELQFICGSSKGCETHENVIGSPIIYPLKVKVDGEVMIKKSREMMEIPSFIFGEFEARG